MFELAVGCKVYYCHTLTVAKGSNENINGRHHYWPDDSLFAELITQWRKQLTKDLEQENADKQKPMKVLAEYIDYMESFILFRPSLFDQQHEAPSCDVLLKKII